MGDIRESLEGGRGGETRDLSFLFCLGLCLLHGLYFLSGSSFHWTVPLSIVPSHQVVLVAAKWSQLWTLLTTTSPLIVSSTVEWQWLPALSVFWVISPFPGFSFSSPIICAINASCWIFSVLEYLLVSIFLTGP